MCIYIYICMTYIYIYIYINIYIHTHTHTHTHTHSHTYTHTHVNICSSLCLCKRQWKKQTFLYSWGSDAHEKRSQGSRRDCPVPLPPPCKSANLNTTFFVLSLILWQCALLLNNACLTPATKPQQSARFPRQARRHKAEVVLPCYPWSLQLQDCMPGVVHRFHMRVGVLSTVLRHWLRLPGRNCHRTRGKQPDWA